MVAVKALKAGCGPQLRRGWRREIDILRTLYHEHIVKYKGCCGDQGGRGRKARATQGLSVPGGGCAVCSRPPSTAGAEMGGSHLQNFARVCPT